MVPKKRIEKLEKQTSADNEHVLRIIADLGDGFYEYKGERMTFEEYQRRYPKRHPDDITLIWNIPSVVG